MIRIVTQSLKIISILVVAVLVVGGSATFFNYWSDRTESEDNGTPVKIQITAEDDTGSVADKLVDKELIRYKVYFEGRMRLAGDDLKPGTYTLRKGMSVNEIIKVITVNDDPEAETSGDEGDEGDVVDQDITIVFIEGQRIEEFATTAEAAGLPGGRQAFLDAAANPENRSRWTFLSDLPEDSSLEGFLFPATYILPVGSDADDLIEQMLSAFDVNFTPSMREQADSDGLSITEVVTLASLVEREAAVAEERPIVAKVYLNRIEQGMSLDADPILQYTVGDQGDGNWWPVLDTALLEEAKANGFDTYSEVGLPPGPIANPGLASIQAVLDPEDVSYLFFVAKNDDSREHVFADTLEEQTANICENYPEYPECQ